MAQGGINHSGQTVEGYFREETSMAQVNRTWEYVHCYLLAVKIYEVQLTQIHLLGGWLCIIHARFRSLWPQTKLGLEMRHYPLSPLVEPPVPSPSCKTLCQWDHGEMWAEPVGSWIVWDSNSSCVCDRVENGMKRSGIHCFQLEAWCLVTFQ